VVTPVHCQSTKNCGHCRASWAQVQARAVMSGTESGKHSTGRTGHYETRGPQPFSPSCGSLRRSRLKGLHQHQPTLPKLVSFCEGQRRSLKALVRSSPLRKRSTAAYLENQGFDENHSESWPSTIDCRCWNSAQALLTLNDLFFSMCLRGRKCGS
jgi:hypothetical protein